MEVPRLEARDLVVLLLVRVRLAAEFCDTGVLGVAELLDLLCARVALGREDGQDLVVGQEAGSNVERLDEVESTKWGCKTWKG